MIKVVKESMKIGAVVSEFNYDITTMMFERAKEHANFLGAEITETVQVPGVFDMGLAIKKMLENKNIDGAVALGAVIEGETEHPWHGEDFEGSQALVISNRLFGGIQ